eukprot:471769_1
MFSLIHRLMSATKLHKALKIFGVATTSACLLLFARNQYFKIYRKFKKYPPVGPIGIPLFGSLFQFSSNPTQFLLDIGKDYGKIATVSIGRRTNIFINDARLAQYLLKNGHTLNRSKMFAKTRASKSNILPLLNGKEWEKRRKYGASKLLTITSSNFIFNSVSDTIDKYVIPAIDSCISSNTLWNASLYTEYITFNSIFSALFGSTIDLDIHDKNNFFTKWDTLINELSDLKSKLHVLNISGFNPPQWLTNMLINGTTIEQGIDGMITEWMQNNGFIIDLNKGKISRNCNKHSFCDEMMNEMNNSSCDYTMDSLIADLGSYLISGYHTTSNCAYYGLLLLATNVGVQDTIYHELLMKTKDKNVNWNDLHIFRAFVFEMIRLSTILPIGLPHFVDKDIECDEYMIPKGSSILINHFYIHKSSANDWRDKLSIHKWLDDNNHFKMNTNFVMFGYGKRDCPGKTLALKQLYSMFARLIKQYKFALPQHIDPTKFKIQQRWRALLEIYPKVSLKVEKRRV